MHRVKHVDCPAAPASHICHLEHSERSKTSWPLLFYSWALTRFLPLLQFDHNFNHPRNLGVALWKEAAMVWVSRYLEWREFMRAGSLSTIAISHPIKHKTGWISQPSSRCGDSQIAWRMETRPVQIWQLSRSSRLIKVVPAAHSVGTRNFVPRNRLWIIRRTFYGHDSSLDQVAQHPERYVLYSRSDYAAMLLVVYGDACTRKHVNHQRLSSCLTESAIAPSSSLRQFKQILFANPKSFWLRHYKMG